MDDFDDFDDDFEEDSVEEVSEPEDKKETKEDFASWDEPEEAVEKAVEETAESADAEQGVEDEIKEDISRSEGFLNYQYTTKYVSHNGSLCPVKIDFDGNYLIEDDPHDINTDIYLTADELENRTLEKRISFKNAWYSAVFSYVRLQKVVVTYMDGTTETIDGSVAD